MTKIKVIIDKPDSERRKTFLGEMLLAAKESPLLFIRPVLGVIDSIRSDTIEVVGDEPGLKHIDRRQGFVKLIPPKKHLRRHKEFEVRLVKPADTKPQGDEISVCDLRP